MIYYMLRTKIFFTMINNYKEYNLKMSFKYIICLKNYYNNFFNFNYLFYIKMDE